MYDPAIAQLIAAILQLLESWYEDDAIHEAFAHERYTSDLLPRLRTQFGAGFVERHLACNEQSLRRIMNYLDFLDGLDICDGELSQDDG